MVKDTVFSPHYDFYIETLHRDSSYEMHSFHFHKKYEIYYLYEGTRRYFIDDKAYLVNAGNMVIISPDEVHRTASVGDGGHTRSVMNFSDKMINAYDDLDMTSCFKTGTHLIYTPPKMRALIESIIKRLVDKVDDESPESVAFKKTLLAELLLYINQMVKDQGNTDPIDSSEHNDTIDAIQSYISEHYREELSLTLIASKFYLSSSYLSRLFKKVTSLSIVDYINSVRLMAAKNLLDNTDTKISDISSYVGFSSPVHFVRVFKASTGLTPQKYRKYYRQPK